ncbi:hypothetical protein ASE16_03570 [Leifsonia sp. Root227]|uniref:DUF7341 domain-containing protein n=1 Tax=Leifsonia sp. Root227 TaxID=1736496 RepID=UPI0006FAA0D1|nr:hypothetical protein [Leifsonia sp. Root227]KRC52140.1 hypothetical protein ASE16_03570 [Leifsonia sp. Root227]
MSDLLDAVDRLTVPQRLKQMQDTQLVTVVLPSLLDQLDAAVRSSMGGTSSGGSTAFEGSIVNSAALMKLMQISHQVADWCRIRQCPVVRDTAKNLRVWYVSTLATDFNPEFATRQLDNWADAIVALLDPPRQKDLPDACPDCEATKWWKNQHEGGLRPLVVFYRPGESVEAGSAECRACGRKWSVRELAYAIEQKTES